MSISNKFLLMLFLSTATLLCGCSSDGEDEGISSANEWLVGTWVGSGNNGRSAIITFNKDRTGSLHLEGHVSIGEYQFTYSVKGTTVTAKGIRSTAYESGEVSTNSYTTTYTYDGYALLGGNFGDITGYQKLDSHGNIIPATEGTGKTMDIISGHTFVGVLYGGETTLKYSFYRIGYNYGTFYLEDYLPNGSSYADGYFYVDNKTIRLEFEGGNRTTTFTLINNTTLQDELGTYTMK